EDVDRLRSTSPPAWSRPCRSFEFGPRYPRERQGLDQAPRCIRVWAGHSTFQLLDAVDAQSSPVGQRLLRETSGEPMLSQEIGEDLDPIGRRLHVLVTGPHASRQSCDCDRYKSNERMREARLPHVRFHRVAAWTRASNLEVRRLRDRQTEEPKLQTEPTE